MPKLDGILETAIRTEDMVRARAFYEGVLGLEPIYSDNRLSAYAVAGRDVLLVFRKGRPLSCPAGPFPAMVVMACCMWRSPLARTNSVFGRHISLRAALPSKGATIGNAVDAASISAIRTGTYWNSQRRDCGQYTRRSGIASHRPKSIRADMTTRPRDVRFTLPPIADMPSFNSITASARAISAGGTARPSALKVG
jgi:catechol 2,3-dioxygenase-like lactoylglutathione lyase family enzyme